MGEIVHVSRFEILQTDTKLAPTFAAQNRGATRRACRSSNADKMKNA